MNEPRRLSRRAFLRALTGATVGGAALGRALRAADAPRANDARGAFHFIVVNDLHHASAECTPFFAQLVAQMRTHGRIAFCLLVGDLADKGERDSLVAIRRTFRRLGAPLHPVPGNHDCDVTQDPRLYSEIFPDKLNHHFAHRGWQFVGLDSTEGSNWGDTHIQPATLAWLDRTLPRLDRTRPTVVFTHFPLAVGLHPRLVPRNAADVVGRFDGFNLRAAFSGHFHARRERTHGPQGGVIVNNACCARVRDNHDGTIPEGYLLCTAHHDGTLAREFVRFAPAENPNATSAPG